MYAVKCQNKKRLKKKKSIPYAWKVWAWSCDWGQSIAYQTKSTCRCQARGLRETWLWALRDVPSRRSSAPCLCPIRPGNQHVGILSRVSCFGPVTSDGGSDERGSCVTKVGLALALHAVLWSIVLVYRSGIFCILWKANSWSTSSTHTRRKTIFAWFVMIIMVSEYFERSGTLECMDMSRDALTSVF